MGLASLIKVGLALCMTLLAEGQHVVQLGRQCTGGPLGYGSSKAVLVCDLGMGIESVLDGAFNDPEQAALNGVSAFV